MLFAPSRKGRKRQKKGEKGRFRPISGKGGQTPLKPPFVTPPFAAAQMMYIPFLAWENKGKGYTPKVWKEGYTPWRPQTPKRKKGGFPQWWCVLSSSLDSSRQNTRGECVRAIADRPFEACEHCNGLDWICQQTFSGPTSTVLHLSLRKS